MKVLVIDDDIIQNKSLCKCLEHLGYTFCSALDGHSGIRLALTEHPDLIILDHRLPGLPGIDTFRQLKAAHSTCTIPIIMMTSDLLKPDEHEVKSAGGFYLIKSLKPDWIAFYIKKALEPSLG